MKMRTGIALPLALAALAGAALAAAPREGQPVRTTQTATDPYVLGFTLTSIEGEAVDLSRYKGKVVVMVNVASECGYTPQYEGLQKLYEANRERGLVVLGFPANDFKGQEPGSNEEIAAFCKQRFGVTFPLFEKISVKGPDQHPLYKKLSAQPEPIGGDPKWNFTKFVVDRSGHVVARFDAERAYVRTPQLEPGLLARVDELLESPGPTGPGTPPDSRR